MEPQQTQQPQPQSPQAPQFQTNGAPMQKSGKTMKIIIGIVVLAILAGLGYYMLKGQNTVAPSSENQVQSVSQNKTETELNQLEAENNNADFSQVDTDFGAEVNAAAQ